MGTGMTSAILRWQGQGGLIGCYALSSLLPARFYPPHRVDRWLAAPHRAEGGRQAISGQKRNAICPKQFITGATDALAFWPRKLAEAGHHILVHGRNKDRLASVSQQLDGAPAYLADFSDMAEVTAMAEAVIGAHKQIDVLINNAGILKTAETETRAGRDIRFDVNMLAPYILTRLLLPVIPAAGRVINLSSAAQAPVDIAAMMRFQPMPDMSAYAQSKLAIPSGHKSWHAVRTGL